MKPSTKAGWGYGKVISGLLVVLGLYILFVHHFDSKPPPPSPAPPTVAQPNSPSAEHTEAPPWEMERELTVKMFKDLVNANFSDLLSKPDAIEAKEPEAPPLTPSQRLVEAKKALAAKSKTMPNGNWGVAEDHLKAISKEAAEFKEAQKLLKEIEKHQKKAVAIAKAQIDKYLSVRRREFADKLENGYLSKGLDITVRATGPQNTTLVLTWVLMSRPLVYKMSNEAGFFKILEDRGFKKVSFKDGYRHSWSYKLNP